MNKIKNILEYLFLFIVGGSIYYLIETIYKGITKGTSSHWSMFILGGACFIVIGLINQFYITWDMNIFKQMLIGSIVITTFEFITGCIVNLWLGWNIWNYSKLPFNILGQICAPFMVLWFFISFIAILLDDFIRYKLFGEEKPHYYFKNN